MAASSENCVVFKSSRLQGKIVGVRDVPRRLAQNIAMARTEDSGDHHLTPAPLAEASLTLVDCFNFSVLTILVDHWRSLNIVVDDLL
jgi:hypothetical protein